jgi:hypothetical protein
MKAQDFNKDYEIDRSIPRGLSAARKDSKPAFPEALLGDNTPFDPEKEYFFFDRGAEVVRGTGGLRRVDANYLGAMGFRIVAIAELRTDRNDALSDAQRVLRTDIEKLRNQIQHFEAQKTPEARSLKSFLMVKD